MSSALTVIVLGQAYFLNTAGNVSSNFGQNSHGSLISKEPGYGETRRDDYTYTSGVGIHKLHTEPTTWSNAELTCEEEGGHLAIVNSNAESEAVAKLFLKLGSELAATRSQYAFIGFRKRLHGDGFVTVRGQTLENAGFNVWAATEPNNLHNSEHCGSVYMDGKLNDINCDDTFNFICELPLLALDLPQSTETEGFPEPCIGEQATTSSILDIPSV